MKSAVRVVQVLVGVLFIVSGLVKANDPVGLGYKMQEFFELWNGELAAGSFFAKSAFVSFFNALHKSALGLSVVMITLEVLAGVALLLGWQKNVVLWALLALIVFFTFLTGYAYLSGKFTNCGCFGDCLPITPLTSFLKDVFLTAAIVFLLFGRRYIQPLIIPKKAIGVLAAAAMLTLVVQWYALSYLPAKDCLPFKVGNNIPQQLKPPSGAVADSFAIRFVYEKGGKRFEFAPENLPVDFDTYTYIERKQSLVRKGNAEAPVKGFSLTGANGEDSSAVVLSQPRAVLAYAQTFSQAWIQDFRQVLATARGLGVPVYLASPDRIAAETAFASAGITGVQFFNSDFTVVRTVARTSPTVMLLNHGTITHKFSKAELSKASQSLVMP